MTIATISREGLTVTAILVACLWVCLGLERLSVRQANHEYYRTLRDMQLLQTRTRPCNASGKSRTIQRWSVNGASNNRLIPRHPA